MHKNPPATNRVFNAFQSDFPELFTYPRKFNDLSVLQDHITVWAAKYPDDVHIVNCDDAMFASSMLVLIEHKSEKQYWGTSVLYIPQCQGEPTEFFLYPSHHRELLKALESIESKKHA